MERVKTENENAENMHSAQLRSYYSFHIRRRAPFVFIIVFKQQSSLSIFPPLRNRHKVHSNRQIERFINFPLCGHIKIFQPFLLSKSLSFPFQFHVEFVEVIEAVEIVELVGVVIVVVPNEFLFL